MSTAPRQVELRQEDDRVSRASVILGMLVVLAIAGIMVVWACAATAAREASLRPTLDFPEQRLGPRRARAGINQYVFEEQYGLGEIQGERQRRRLEAYRWIDQDRRIVTLPIDRAMDRIAEERGR